MKLTLKVNVDAIKAIRLDKGCQALGHGDRVLLVGDDVV